MLYYSFFRFSFSGEESRGRMRLQMRVNRIRCVCIQCELWQKIYSSAPRGYSSVFAIRNEEQNNKINDRNARSVRRTHIKDFDKIKDEWKSSSTISSEANKKKNFKFMSIAQQKDGFHFVRIR